MLTYSFLERKNEPLYEYLYKCIRADILSGRLQPHEKLPSKRSFASNQGVSLITVENTYAQLMSEGYIYSLPQKGYYVAHWERDHTPVIKQEDSETEGAPLAAEKERVPIDFTSNETRADIFPFATWSRLMRQVLNKHQEDLLANAPGSGVPALRQAIAAHLRAFRGMQVRPEQVIIGAGTEYLYGLILQLLGRDKLYAIEDPGYSKIEKVYQSLGAQCYRIPMDASGLRVDSLQQKGIQVAHISPSHHFPTGIVMPIGRRMELLSWASAAEDRFIIEDDYDSEFRMTGRLIPTLQSIDTTGRVIYINTFTKTLASTIRISYMILPMELARKFEQRLSFYACTVSNFEQYTLAEFIGQGFFEKHLNRMRNEYHTCRDALMNALRNSQMATCVSVEEEDAGLHFLMTVDTPRDDEAFTRDALRHGVRISPLSYYYSGEGACPEHVFVINYSSLCVQDMDDAVSRLWETYQDKAI